ncbi:hypothetical protein ACWCV5_17400 [Streptomyces tubercidicus]|uniref:Uncharacterized protein n=1 Tax=Streptomyces tubercidicus TaxID=47759 RepID=A0A640UXK4_9ACTN|nr:hypothetical protein Stube_55510 [Streptomyces tubercidicus]
MLCHLLSGGAVDRFTASDVESCDEGLDNSVGAGARGSVDRQEGDEPREVEELDHPIVTEVQQTTPGQHLKGLHDECHLQPINARHQVRSAVDKPAEVPAGENRGPDQCEGT